MRSSLAMKIALFVFLGILAAFAAAIYFGGPDTPAPIQTINDPFKSVDYSNLPSLKTYKGGDATDLYYREYEAVGGPTKGSAVLVHGSSADSTSLHPMAQALAKAGFRVFALDVRGHGSSGRKGQIDYIGQLEFDLEAFVKSVRPPSPSTLVGFSSGGGFVLRIAGSQRQSSFQSFLLLSPFLGSQSPSQRPNSGGWVSVGMPRLLGILFLNSVGIKSFNSLPVTRFALSEEAKTFLTPEYGYNLTINFAPNREFMNDIRASNGRVAILAGKEDEAFFTDAFEAIVQRSGKSWPVTLLPGIGHIPLTLDPNALDAIVREISQLQCCLTPRSS